MTALKASYSQPTCTSSTFYSLNLCPALPDKGSGQLTEETKQLIKQVNKRIKQEKQINLLESIEF